ncbi:Hypothetical_protein [Hexamita inflata]|uniref:Hypothetical_protein n=1 Tax=Hexamita inflata TaxID=28002 RepID=A0AA86R0A2_9EUKA|nr:Hypothetical protein HINF_LOCUS56976 [Hexamita inflata]
MEMFVRQEWKPTKPSFDLFDKNGNEMLTKTAFDGLFWTRMEMLSFDKLVCSTRINQAGLFDKNGNAINQAGLFDKFVVRQEWLCQQPSWFVLTRMETKLTKLVCSDKNGNAINQAGYQPSWFVRQEWK